MYKAFSFLVLILSSHLVNNLILIIIQCIPLHLQVQWQVSYTKDKFDVFLHKKCLQLIPLIGKAGKQFVIKLHPCLSVGTFKPLRFSPKKNNVRQNWFNGEEGIAEDGAGKLKSILHVVTLICNFVLGNVLHVIFLNYHQLIEILE